VHAQQARRERVRAACHALFRSPVSHVEGRALQVRPRETSFGLIDKWDRSWCCQVVRVEDIVSLARPYRETEIRNENSRSEPVVEVA